MAKAKVIQSEHSCTILVEGDPKKRLEPAENIIIFPGGSISVIRTSNNEYWAHIEVNRRGQVLTDGSGGHRAMQAGLIVDSRVDYFYPDRQSEVAPINNPDALQYVDHVAIRIRTSNGQV